MPVPSRFRRRMIALGSGDPTRAICSALIAQAFESVGYPILPEITHAPGRAHAKSMYSKLEIMHIRHHSLFAPRDFDLSPYFAIIKPTLQSGFDFTKIGWIGKTSADDLKREHRSEERAAGSELPT